MASKKANSVQIARIPKMNRLSTKAFKRLRRIGGKLYTKGDRKRVKSNRKQNSAAQDKR